MNHEPGVRRTRRLVPAVVRRSRAALWHARSVIDRGLQRLGIDMLGSSSRDRKVYLVLMFHNEMRFLPGFFRNVLPHVDGFVALDDGSTDGSAEYVARQPGLLLLLHNPVTNPHVWDEPAGRRRLIEAISHHDPEWILALDADERLEKDFGRRARREIRRAEQFGYATLSLRLLELWNRPDTARIDGIWGRKFRARLFRWRPDHNVSETAWHGQWTSDDPGEERRRVRADLILYHLRMIDPEDRARRMQRYKELDPDCRHQSIGYDYLVDETGMRLAKVDPERTYLPEGPATEDADAESGGTG